jgi:hypothetical protein
MNRRTRDGDVNRRFIIQGAALATVSGWASSAACTQGAVVRAVMFPSRLSNTRMLAGDLSRRFGA